MTGRLILIALAVLIVLVVVVLVEPGKPTTTVPPSAAPGTQVTVPSTGERANVVRGNWYVLGFTNPLMPDRKDAHRGGIDTLLVDRIGQSTKTLDVADYDFDLQSVARAMAEAQQRGVRVRMVTDTDTLEDTKNAEIQAAFKIVKDAGIPIVDDRRPAIMHNKFTIIDGEWVSTGSWNYTDGDTFRLNNWMGVFHSPDLADNYTTTFEQMFSKKNFSSTGRVTLPHPKLENDGTPVQNCFSPDGGCEDLIVRTINQRAQRAIQFLAFSFTSDKIGDAMLDKARRGVKVEGVFETTGSNTQYSEYGPMKKAGLPVLTDGNPYSMHHKVIVIDDQVTIAGSYNFSNNADKDNNENLLIIDDPAIAKAFHDEYNRVRAVAERSAAGSR